MDPFFLAGPDDLSSRGSSRDRDSGVNSLESGQAEVGPGAEQGDVEQLLGLAMLDIFTLESDCGV